MTLGELRRLIREVDLDPSNNPGRPSDPYEYLGMHPDPKAAMAHPAASGGSVSLASDSGSGSGDSGGSVELPDAAANEGTDEPT